MKHYLILAIIGIALMLIAAPVKAQIPLSAKGAMLYNYQTLASAKTYANSQKDTLGWTSAGTNVGIKVASAGEVEIETITQDSAYYILKVQYRADSNATWTDVKLDTLNQTGGGTVSTPTKKETVVKGKTANAFTGMTGEMRVIYLWQATINGVTTPTYRSRLIWKP